jgi:hypothetical protein
MRLNLHPYFQAFLVWVVVTVVWLFIVFRVADNALLQQVKADADFHADSAFCSGFWTGTQAAFDVMALGTNAERWSPKDTNCNKALSKYLWKVRYGPQPFPLPRPRSSSGH